MSRKTLISILPILLWSFFGCIQNRQNGNFDLNGKSKITFVNQSKDSVKIQISNWYLIPMNEQKIDTTIAPNTNAKFDLIAQGYDYYRLTIEKNGYNIFFMPGLRDIITIYNNKDLFNVSFSGDLKPMNEFHHQKSNYFNSIDAEWLPRVNATRSCRDAKSLIALNDSLTKIHLQYLDNNKSTLPRWYVEYERERLEYLSAESKLSSLFYRKKMLNIKDSIPPDFLEKTIGSLPINNEKFLGDDRYFSFLNMYTAYLYDAKIENPDTKNSEYKSNLDSDIIRTELNGLVRDVYLTVSLNISIDQFRHSFEEKRIEEIKDAKLKNYLYNYLRTDPFLPKGTDLPFFILMDSSGTYHESKELYGNILLINFWSTSCLPCIKEFPFENELVERFEGKPVKVINICMESSLNSWKKLIQKHNLKTYNLFANKNWSETLNKKFDIKGWPHSVLVDWKGKIVRNKCPRTSNNVDELIRDLLNEMKKNDNL